jgi:hypothetical protein
MSADRRADDARHRFNRRRELTPEEGAARRHAAPPERQRIANPSGMFCRPIPIGDVEKRAAGQQADRGNNNAPQLHGGYQEGLARRRHHHPPAANPIIASIRQRGADVKKSTGSVPMAMGS